MVRKDVSSQNHHQTLQVATSDTFLLLGLLDYVWKMITHPRVESAAYGAFNLVIAIDPLHPLAIGDFCMLIWCTIAATTSNLNVEFCKNVKYYAMFCFTVIFNICSLLIYTTVLLLSFILFDNLITMHLLLSHMKVMYDWLCWCDGICISTYVYTYIECFILICKYNYFYNFTMTKKVGRYVVIFTD